MLLLPLTILYHPSVSKLSALHTARTAPSLSLCINAASLCHVLFGPQSRDRFTLKQLAEMLTASAGDADEDDDAPANSSSGGGKSKGAKQHRSGGGVGAGRGGWVPPAKYAKDKRDAQAAQISAYARGYPVFGMAGQIANNPLMGAPPWALCNVPGAAGAGVAAVGGGAHPPVYGSVTALTRKPMTKADAERVVQRSIQTMLLASSGEQRESCIYLYMA